MEFGAHAHSGSFGRSATRRHLASGRRREWSGKTAYIAHYMYIYMIFCFDVIIKLALWLILWVYLQGVSLSLMQVVFGQKCCRCGSLRNDDVAGRGLASSRFLV